MLQNENLRRCPLCGGELTVRGGPEDWSPTFSDPDSGGQPLKATCICGFEVSEHRPEWTRIFGA